MEYHIQRAELELTIQSEFGKGSQVQVSIASITQNKKKRGSHEDGH